MSSKATTIRFEPKVKDQLVTLSRAVGKPINRLANEAIQEYLEKTSFEVERDLEDTLAALRAYKQKDPDFEQAIKEFAKAEVSSQHDPAQGEEVMDKTIGPTERSIQAILRDS